MTRSAPNSFTRFVDAIQYVIGVAAATTVVLLFSLGDDPMSTGAPTAETAGQSSSDLVIGQRIYADECAICHGPTGAGGTGPALDAELIDKYPDPQAQELIVAFGLNAMTGFTDRLTPEQINAVVTYTRVALGSNNGP